MATDNATFSLNFSFLSGEDNARLKNICRPYEVSLIEARESLKGDDWARAESGEYQITHRASFRLVDVLFAMVKALCEAVMTSNFSVVGSSEYEERVELVERQIVEYAMKRWIFMLRGLPMVQVNDQLSNEELLLPHPCGNGSRESDRNRRATMASRRGAGALRRVR